ncbi:MAG: UvrD-helicase domain-containing protein [Bacilli bacterium]
MPNWTKEQQQAIDTEGTNIIVSAGAGSGKTAVLTERVLRKLKQGVDIDHLLILTFTKAAASEMKERIRASISKDPNLKKQLDMLDGAYITTFDSYAFSVVKKYHYLENISKNITIGDQTIINIKKEEILDQIFEELYAKSDKLFLSMITSFCTKDDINIKEAILDISNKLDMRYDKETYLTNYISSYFSSNTITSRVTSYTQLLLHKIELIRNKVEELVYLTSGEFIDKLEDAIEPLLEASTYKEIKAGLDIKLPALPNGSQEEAKATKEFISSLMKELRAMTSYIDEEEIRETILLTKDVTESIIEIILTLDDRVNAFKNDKEIYEFTDISKLAIHILEENIPVREELKNYFSEIMVDEYQDTNDLQETFISFIENNNVYMVGDIKQSIYRFRNANPYIFKNKYDKYKEHIGGEKIDLNKNFRSREEVLNNINTVFDLIMDDLIGGAAYKDSHRMIFGNLTYQEEGIVDHSNDLEILSFPVIKDSLYKKEEIEVFIIANDIKNKVASQYKIFDKDKKEIRTVSYSDFVILLDRASQFDLYKRIFSFLGIPLATIKDENMTGDTDLGLLKNIINLIVLTSKNDSSTAFKYSYISVARSYLYRLSDQEILDTIDNNTYKDSAIMEIVKEIASHLESYTARTLVNTVITRFPFYERIITAGNINNSLVRFEYLENMATVLEESGYTVYDLYTYLETIINNNLELKYSIHEETSNSCKIMTIHKSKGLEYPICYYAGLSNKFNISDLKAKFVYDKNFGIIVPYFKEGIGETINKPLLKEAYLIDEVSEKIRLFYVAMTRAKEKMILILPEGDNNNEEDLDNEIDLNTKLKYNSFMSIINSIKPILKPYITNIDLANIPMSKDYNIMLKKDFTKLLPRADLDIIVREITGKEEYIETKHYSKNMIKLLSKETDDARQLGIKFHELLENIDLRNPDLEGLDSFYKIKIEAFCQLDLLKDIGLAKIYKEYEFITRRDKEEFHGIIDLLLEYDDHCIIIDYKLNSTLDPAYLSQLNGYKDYIINKTNKKTTIYLYSILKEELVLVE